MNSVLATSIPWSLIIPIIIVQLLLQVASLISLVKSKGVQRGNKAIWAIVIVLFQLIGCILYWTLGRDAND